MTAPRWAGLGHAEIVAMVAAGPGPSASAGAERAWRAAAAALADVHRELGGRARDLPGAWSGRAADGVTGAFVSLDGWVASAAVDAGRTADALAAQAGLAADLRARMPAAPAASPPETAPAGPDLLDDWAAADLDAGNSAGRAAELMVRYDDDTRATGAPWTGWGASPVVTRDGGGSPPPDDRAPAPAPGAAPIGPGAGAGAVPPGGQPPSGTTVYAGLGLGGITAAVLTGNGRAGVPGARPVDVGGPPVPRSPAATSPAPGTDGTGSAVSPGDGAPTAASATPVGDDGAPGGSGTADDGTDASVTAAVLAGGALGGAGLLIAATISRERRTRDGRPAPGDDPAPGDHAAPDPTDPTDPTDPGGPPTDGPGDGRDGPESGAAHRPPSGDVTTSGTRAPSGTPDPAGPDLPAHDAPPPGTGDGTTSAAPPEPGRPTGGADPADPVDGTPGTGTPATGAPTPGSNPDPGPAGQGPATPGPTGRCDTPQHPDPGPGPLDGPAAAARHSVTTGDVPVTGAPAHGTVVHDRWGPSAPPTPGVPAVTAAGVPVGPGAGPVPLHPGAVAAPTPAAVGAGPAPDARTPALRLVTDEHSTDDPDDLPERPDARPEPGVLRPDARWRGRG